jgi:hypothetical protein
MLSTSHSSFTGVDVKRVLCSGACASVPCMGCTCKLWPSKTRPFLLMRAYWALHFAPLQSGPNAHVKESWTSPKTRACG